jgi:hypothetical protein
MTIVSYQHRFIFIKTRKVAGTSVEAFLRSLAGPDDVITHLTPRDEYFCARRGQPAQNYARRAEDEARYTDLVLEERFDEAFALDRSMRKRFSGHMTAGEIRRRTGKRVFRDFYKFAIERDPYSWLVSLVAFDKAAYRRGSGRPLELAELRELMLERLQRKRFLAGTNYPFYTLRNRLAVDRLIRFEHLETDLAGVLADLGIETPVALPRLKDNPQRWSLSEIYTPELDALLKERCAPIFEVLACQADG